MLAIQFLTSFPLEMSEKVIHEKSRSESTRESLEFVSTKGVRQAVHLQTSRPGLLFGRVDSDIQVQPLQRDSA